MRQEQPPGSAHFPGKTDGGPTPGITFSSNSRRTSSQNALMHPFSTFGLLVHFRQFTVARPCIYPGLPSCGAGGVGLLGPGVCGLGGADTLNIGCSLWQDCSLHCTAPRQLDILPLLTRGIASQHSVRTTGFQPFPPLTAAPRWRVGWLGSPSFPSAGVAPMTSPSAKSSRCPKLPENCDVCGNQLPSHLARIGVTRHPQCREGGHPP